MCFEFISATEADKAYLFKLRKLTMLEHLEKSGQCLTDEEHEFRLSDTYECSHMIVYDGLLLGTLKYRELVDRVKIMQIQIHPDFQGKGLGRRIMKKILHEAGHKFVELTVLKNNRALKLYQSLGFDIVAEDQYEYCMRRKC